MGVILLNLLALALAVYAVGLVFTSNFNMGNLLVWLLATKRCRFAVERASLLSLAIAFAVPFVWYFLLRNHSLVHCWMTYRNLSAAVFALSGGLCFGLKGNGFPEN